MIYKIHPLFLLFAFIFTSCSNNVILNEPCNEKVAICAESNELTAIGNYIKRNHLPGELGNKWLL